jgi:galactokinase/mevalonate kinase-like predicted kinase
MYRFVVFFLLITCITSCSEEYGHRVEGKNITIYFEEETDLEQAKSLAKFWKKNKFIGKRKQDLKLIQNKKTYELYLIRSEALHGKKLLFPEQKKLFQLQKMLNDSLQFKKPIELVISNKRFEPVLKLK